jgi:hypothetical protein
VTLDHIIGKRLQPIGIAARREELEGADADMARRDTGKHRARQHLLAIDWLPGRNSR